MTTNTHCTGCGAEITLDYGMRRVHRDTYFRACDADDQRLAPMPAETLAAYVAGGAL